VVCLMTEAVAHPRRVRALQVAWFAPADGAIRER
jgi:hypothetical protein